MSNLLLLILAGCSSSPEVVPEPEPVVEEAPEPAVDVAALRKSRNAMKTLGKTLKGELLAAMKEDGPVAALEMCSGRARELTDSVAKTAGVSAGRSSLRLRNPENVGPDWVQSWLSAQGERPFDGVDPQVSTATVEGVEVVRVVAPIQVEAPCLVCHGPDESRPPELSAAIAERYPEDKATGYALGDLRGAIWAEAAVVASE